MARRSAGKTIERAAEIGVGKWFYFPCCAGPRSEPSAGLAIVHHQEVLVAEVRTVLDADQLDADQERNLRRWPGPAPLMAEVEAPPPRG